MTATSMTATASNLTGDAAVLPARPVAADMMADDEVWLVERAQAGDRDAFGALYQRYGPDVLRFLRKRLRNDQAEVDDIAAEVFLVAIDKIGTFRLDEPGEFVHWLLGIARNRLLMRWAWQKRHPETGLSLGWERRLIADTPNPEEIACLRLELARLFSKLTPQARRVVALRHVAGLRCGEVAHAVGVSERMVSFFTGQARATLAERPNWTTPVGHKGAAALSPALCACGCGVGLPADRHAAQRFATRACRDRMRRTVRPALQQRHLTAPAAADPAVDRVLAAVAAVGAEGTTRADLNRHLRLPAARLDRIVALLADRGQVRERREAPTAMAKRPTIRYFAVRRAAAGRAA